MPPSADQARLLLCELGEYLRSLVMSARDIDMAAVTGETVADTIYAIDRVADDALVGWFEEHWPDVRIVSEGLDDPVVVGDDAAWTVIVDTIDGTRGLMYDKRPAWCLAAAAPPGGSLGDIVAAAMTELPTMKQGAVDQLSGVRGSGLVAERLDLRRGAREPLVLRPSSATDLEHSFSGFAKFFLPGSRPSSRSRPNCSGDSAAVTSSTTSISRPVANSTSSSAAGTASSPTCARWSSTMRAAWPAIRTTSAPPCCWSKRAAW